MISITASSTHNKFPSGCRLLREGKRAILVRNRHEEELRNEGLLNPSGLWKRSSPSDHLMGRGEVLLIKGKQGEVAVRKYRHGGLLRRLTGDLFFFGARPFQEAAVTEEVKSAGVPTVEILAAIIDRRWGGWYRGYLVTRYLSTATDLISYLDEEPQGERRKAVIAKAGEAVKKMHQRGIYHADLHLKNFLVEGKSSKVYLIDFDKSKVFPRLKPSKRMKNLKRLDRSAEKLTRYGLPLSKGDKSTFCRAYTSGDREIRPYMKSYVQRYRWYQRLYRWGWWIARILYPRSKPWRKSIT
ncbi:MAG: lipopolysaccharide kinase InaA family protein [Deltaproteobacteria bacterium]|jgi:tRNA A-37 threonylcarbamoyl transferase component Bud32